MTSHVRHMTVRTSLIERHASMCAFVKLSRHVLVVVATAMAVVMTVFICVTANLLG